VPSNSSVQIETLNGSIARIYELILKTTDRVLKIRSVLLFSGDFSQQHFSSINVPSPPDLRASTLARVRENKNTYKNTKKVPI